GRTRRPSAARTAASAFRAPSYAAVNAIPRSSVPARTLAVAMCRSAVRTTAIACAMFSSTRSRRPDFTNCSIRSGMDIARQTVKELGEIEGTIGDTVIAWSGETTYAMSSGGGVAVSISGPNVYLAFQAPQGSAGADVDGAATSGWG